MTRILPVTGIVVLLATASSVYAEDALRSDADLLLLAAQKRVLALYRATGSSRRRTAIKLERVLGASFPEEAFTETALRDAVAKDIAAQLLHAPVEKRRSVLRRVSHKYGFRLTDVAPYLPARNSDFQALLHSYCAADNPIQSNMYEKILASPFSAAESATLLQNIKDQTSVEKQKAVLSLLRYDWYSQTAARLWDTLNETDNKDLRMAILATLHSRQQLDVVALKTALASNRHAAFRDLAFTFLCESVYSGDQVSEKLLRSYLKGQSADKLRVIRSLKGTPSEGLWKDVCEVVLDDSAAEDVRAAAADYISRHCIDTNVFKLANIVGSAKLPTNLRIALVDNFPIGIASNEKGQNQSNQILEELQNIAEANRGTELRKHILIRLAEHRQTQEHWNERVSRDHIDVLISALQQAKLASQRQGLSKKDVKELQDLAKFCEKEIKALSSNAVDAQRLAKVKDILSEVRASVFER